MDSAKNYEEPEEMSVEENSEMSKDLQILKPTKQRNDKICPICKEESKTPHTPHYGGIACFSCKAFFRRAHQETTTTNFKCKNHNQCDVTVKTRRKCQKCRYNLCLLAGMKPDQVLTNEQKQFRFQSLPNWDKRKPKEASSLAWNQGPYAVQEVEVANIPLGLSMAEANGDVVIKDKPTEQEEGPLDLRIRRSDLKIS